MSNKPVEYVKTGHLNGFLVSINTVKGNNETFRVATISALNEGATHDSLAELLITLRQDGVDVVCGDPKVKGFDTYTLKEALLPYYDDVSPDQLSIRAWRVLARVVRETGDRKTNVIRYHRHVKAERVAAADSNAIFLLNSRVEIAHGVPYAQEAKKKHVDRIVYDIGGNGEDWTSLNAFPGDLNTLVFQGHTMPGATLKIRGECVRVLSMDHGNPQDPETGLGDLPRHYDVLNVGGHIDDKKFRAFAVAGMIVTEAFRAEMETFEKECASEDMSGYSKEAFQELAVTLLKRLWPHAQTFCRNSGMKSSTAAEIKDLFAAQENKELLGVVANRLRGLPKFDGILSGIAKFFHGQTNGGYVGLSPTVSDLTGLRYTTMEYMEKMLGGPADRNLTCILFVNRSVDHLRVDAY